MGMYPLSLLESRVAAQGMELCIDSRKATPGCVFVALPGSSADGSQFIADAVARGAGYVVCRPESAGNCGEAEVVDCADPRQALGLLARARYGTASLPFPVVGVTGTNGKTTTTYLLDHLFASAGKKTGVLGTVSYRWPGHHEDAPMTTPDCLDVHTMLADMRAAGVDMAFMEVSSHALDQYRIGNIHYDVAVFTNLTQDHLDYHKTMENYYQAKKMMFDECDYALINTDDEYGRRIFSEISCKKERYGISSEADYYADAIKIKSDGTSFWYCYNGKSQLVNMKMTGMFNVSNVTAAISVCLKAGLPIEDILKAVSEYNGVKGRCEIIPTGRDFTVICDYAHTPDAVENILKSVREYTEGRLICLFGCGGNRDAKKRPLMAKAAAKFADRLIITSDNPRDEIPEAIIDDILAGLKDSEIPFDVVVDRTKAIHHSLKIAEKGDIIVLAGKGHEDYQVLPGNEHIHFDEREIVSEGLKLID